MPLPRFGSQSRRPTALVPRGLPRVSAPIPGTTAASPLRMRPIPGTTGRGIGASRPIPGTSPFRSAPHFEANQIKAILGNDLNAIRDYQHLRNQGLGMNEAIAAVGVQRQAGNYDRPSQFLSVVARALGVGENSIVGFISGIKHAGDDQTMGQKILAPWGFIAALGHGYSEIPGAIKHNKTFTEFLDEETDPGSFLNRHSKPIGLGMSIFFDPVNYVTFGATATSKITAKTLLTASWRQSSEEALKISAKTGRDFDSVLVEQHVKAARPFTLGDALIDLRKADRAGGAGVTRRLLPRGGRGVRFAGMEIPKTAGLGQRMGRNFRERSSEYLSMRVGTEARQQAAQVLSKGFIPDAKLKSIADDARRSMAMADWRDFVNQSHNLADELAIKWGRGIQKIDDPEIRVAMGLTDDSAAFIPRANRLGAHKKNLADLDPATRRMMEKIDLRVASVKSKAKRSGFSGAQLDHFDDLWDKMKELHNDPVHAVTDFLMRSGTRILTHDFIANMVKNPLYAREIVSTEAREKAVKAAVKEGGPKAARGAVHPAAVESVEEAAQRMPGQEFLPFKYRGKEYAMAEPIVDAIENLRNPMYMNWEINKIFRALNWPQNKWKILATSPNMSFHVMNFVGASWNNMLAGVYNPIDYVNAFTTIYRAKLNNLAKEGEAFMGFAPKVTERGERASQTIAEATKRGGLGRSSFVFAELTRPTAELAVQPKGIKRLYTPGTNISGKTAARRGARLGVRRGRQAAGVAAAATLNPLAAMILAPEAIRAGRGLASLVEDTVRLAPFQKAAKDKSVQQLLEAYGPIRVPGLKHPGFTKAQQSAMYDIGAEISRHFQFDYMDLTEFERKFAKTIFPFYVWFRKNMALQAKEAVNRPRFLNVTTQLENYSEENGMEIGAGMETILPEYFDNINAFQVPVPNAIREKLGLPQDQPLYLNPKLPFVTLNMVPSFWNLFRDTEQPTMQRWGGVFSGLMGMVGPFAPLPVPGAKLMIESYTNTQLGLNRPVDYQRAQSGGWRNSYVPAPGWVKYVPKEIRDAFGAFTPFDFTEKKGTKDLYMTATSQYLLDAMSSPFITNLGNAVPVGGTGTAHDKSRADLVSWMTGVRLIPVDALKIHRSFGYRMENMLESRRAELRSIGRDLSPEDQQQLKLVRYQLKVIESAWDTREQELYGK